MNTSPKISVVIPSYNQGRFIEETLLSLINQNYEPLEIILIDGGSCDNTVNIIRKYEQHLAYWISESDSGQSEAINKGFKRATGEIVTWLNSDDYYNPGILTEVANFFTESKDLDILYGRARLFGEGKKDKIIGPDQELPVYQLFPYMRFPQPSSFFKKKLIDDFGFLNEQLHYTMDFEFVCRILLAGARIKRVDTVLSNYRVHEDSKTNNSLNFLDEWSIIVHRVLSLFDHGKDYARKMETLGLMPKQTLHFNFNQINISLSPTQLKEIFLLHLNLQFHTRYQEFDFNKCSQISRYIKENFPDYYKKESLAKFDRRMNYLPRFLFTLLR